MDAPRADEKASEGDVGREMAQRALGMRDYMPVPGGQTRLSWRWTRRQRGGGGGMCEQSLPLISMRLPPVGCVRADKAGHSMWTPEGCYYYY
jgi:hypothetical protein